MVDAEEHAGRDTASAAGYRRVAAARVAETLIVIDSREKGLGINEMDGSCTSKRLPGGAFGALSM